MSDTGARSQASKTFLEKHAASIKESNTEKVREFNLKRRKNVTIIILIS